MSLAEKLLFLDHLLEKRVLILDHDDVGYNQFLIKTINFLLHCCFFVQVVTLLIFSKAHSLEKAPPAELQTLIIEYAPYAKPNNDNMILEKRPFNITFTFNLNKKLEKCLNNSDVVDLIPFCMTSSKPN